MEKKLFKRVYPKGKLSDAEAARDEEIRRQVQAEFPPLEAESAWPVLSDPLKEAIGRSEKTVRQLAKAASTDPGDGGGTRRRAASRWTARPIAR